MLLQSDALLKAREAREDKDQDHLKVNCTEIFTVKEDSILYHNIPKGRIERGSKPIMRPTVFTLGNLTIVCVTSWNKADRQVYEK